MAGIHREEEIIPTQFVSSQRRHGPVRQGRGYQHQRIKQVERLPRRRRRVRG